MEQLLLNKVMALRYAYYILNESLVTDEQYDVLEKQALLIAPQDHPIRLPGSDLESDYTQTYKDIANILRSKRVIDRYFEVLLADSTKYKDGFTFLFKGEIKEIPTQVFRFTAQSDIEAMSYLMTDHVYLLTRLEDGSEVYRRPYDTWK